MSVTLSNIHKISTLQQQVQDLRAEVQTELENTYPFPQWVGIRDLYYWGPDAYNKRQVLIIGDKVNNAIDQMETQGKRTTNKKTDKKNK